MAWSPIPLPQFSLLTPLQPQLLQLPTTTSSSRWLQRWQLLQTATRPCSKTTPLITLRQPMPGPLTWPTRLSTHRYLKCYYASPTSGEAYRDRRLTTNFELWVEIFCVPTCFHMKIPKPCLSVCLSICPYPEKRNHHSFVNISPTLVIDTSMERSSRVLHHGNPKIWFIFQKSSKFEFWLVTKSWNHLSFVNISPTLVIDTSMERSSRVLLHGNPKIWFFFSKKFEIRILTFDEELKSP